MKALISFLGTGPFEEKGSKRKYRTARYKFNNVENENSFVSLFLAEQLKIDKLYVIGTHKSMWEELYNSIVPVSKQNNEFLLNQLIPEIDKLYDGTWNEEIFDKLEQEINIYSPYPIKILILKYGMDEDEIKYNIEKTIETLKTEFFSPGKNESISLHMDITHSFRSLPILIQQVIQFFIQLHEKKIHFDGIYYGMLEVIKETGFAPVINLSKIAEIGKWANAAYAFENFGNGYLLSDLIQQTNPSESILIKDFSNTLNLNLIFHVKGKIQQLNGILKKEYPFLGQLFISNVLEEFIRQFKNINKDSEFQLQLAKWQYQKKRYGIAVLILYEAMITWICEQESLMPNRKDNRDNAKNLLSTKYINIRNIIRNYKIDDIRNSVAHQLYRQIKVETAIQNIHKAIEKFSDLAKNKN
ncbi:MAG: hypothetical protein KatS3mg034_2083 [Vicingaceae bacterium]|nr:MAG: hypothetical protein KatS3mg034_2083 [Vicingaceae bacterium]